MTLVAMLIAMTSCNKWDCNGDLDGMARVRAMKRSL